MRTDVARLSAMLAAIALIACEGTNKEREIDFTVEQLMDPETCKGCHPIHYEEWASSMHAYAAEDPVFIAMNQRGQRETGGALGDFCVNCHAPMAVIEGATSDGLNLDEVSGYLKGVTCYFCHNVVDVREDHNNGLVIARDDVMRGGIDDPVETRGHFAAFSRFVSANTAEGARMCGSCHDIVTPNGVELERTFKEWKSSVFVDMNTCAGCHMPLTEMTLAAVDPDVRLVTRDIHEHMWPAVDTALTPFPGRNAQRAAIDCQLAAGTRIYSIQADPSGYFELQLETNAGHRQPSGASQDRRLWVEFVAYDDDDNVIFSSGAVADDEVVDKPEEHSDHDRNLKIFRDHIFDENGEEVHMFWEAAPSAAFPKGYESTFLPAGMGLPGDHTHEVSFQVPTGLPARVTVRLRMRPMGLDVLQDLVDSGDLDPSILREMPTFTLDGTAREWRRDEHGFEPVTGPDAADLSYCDYPCLLDPQHPACR